jgi:hypothetical protein
VKSLDIFANVLTMHIKLNRSNMNHCRLHLLVPKAVIRTGSCESDREEDIDNVDNEDNDEDDDDDSIPALASEDLAQNLIVPYLSRQQKKNARNQKKSHMKRDAAVHASKKFSKYSVRFTVKQNYIKNAVPIAINFDSNNFQTTSTGYTGKGGPKHKRIHTLGKMVGEGSKYNFQLEKWDGR